MAKIANFRHYSRRSQCELEFFLDVTIQDIQIHDRFNATRQITDSVGSLIDHIIAKINKLLTVKASEQNKELIAPQIQVAIKRGDFDVKPSLALKNLFHETNLQLVVCGQKFSFIMNAPSIEAIRLPKILYFDCTVQPSIKGQFVHYKRSMSTWYKSKDKKSWTKVGKEFEYTIKEDDIGHYLKYAVVPKSEYHVAGAKCDVISDLPVQKIPQIPKCPFEKRHELTRTKLTDKSFRICTYNVLSERYTEHDDQFAYCDPIYLSNSYRRLLILNEIKGYNADVICMQELDQMQYTKYYKQKMDELEYGSFFYKKGNVVNEGLGFFYNKTRFKSIYNKQIVLRDEVKLKTFEYLWDMIKSNETVREAFIKQNTSLAVMVLHYLGTENYLIVGNTHLYYHPEFSYIRLLQVNVITKYLLFVKKGLQKRNGENIKISVIFCGDFNSRPDSSIYQYMLNGKIHPKHEDCLKISGDGDVTLYHELQFQSAYTPPPTYTNYTLDFKGCLDYIFVDETLKLVKSIPLYENQELEEHEGCPNQVFPSDHFALVADVEFLR